mmetsp:Transcript_25857/g.37540  ORF Transcript_25857/g.37540 Transcript_25857/m.37540 type:complete len:97 (-) Transcript_25857:53-343(-)
MRGQTVTQWLVDSMGRQTRNTKHKTKKQQQQIKKTRDNMEIDGFDYIFLFQRVQCYEVAMTIHPCQLTCLDWIYVFFWIKRWKILRQLQKGGNPFY